MTPVLLLGLIAAYFGLLIFISWLTGRGADNQSFFVGNRKSPWFMVAFGMIGASLSGVTFISVPGWVGSSQFSYMQMVLGYLAGYAVIAFVLMPLYYRLNLISIYGYLQQRFGFWAYKTGALFFFISRLIGASFRLFLVADALQILVFDRLPGFYVPFPVTVTLTVALIWLYTHRGGIRTIVWTDALQTLFMLVAVGVSLYVISSDLGGEGMWSAVASSDYSKWFFWDDWMDKKHFVKQFASGALIAITMTGMDQDMMQKNLSCRNIKDAQKNMVVFSIVLVFVNLLFLALGALLFIYANTHGFEVPEKTDRLFPLMAIDHLGVVAGLFFVLGLIAAAYSSADSALAALTTSVCVDFLNVDQMAEADRERTRKRTHIVVSFLLIIVIMFFRAYNDQNVIASIFVAASYTYGPLLGLFAFGLLTRFQLRDHVVVVVACCLAPLVTFWINANSASWFGQYQFANELLLVNALLTILFLRIGHQVVARLPVKS
ncbi:MAG: sodium:solute symporter [Flavobacteriales bacterium]|nr:sodium:solute symporter [Flavobacteriales bacterium]